MPRAYCITADAIAAERKRVGDDLSKFEAAHVIRLDDVALRDLGPSDVRLRILAVSVEHNVDHAAIADTANIAEARGGKIYPGNSAVGEVTAVGPRVTKFEVGDIVVKVDESTVTGSDGLVAAVRDHSPGDEIEITVLRNGEPVTLTVTLVAR